MYGLVNNLLKDTITLNYGVDCWQKIAAQLDFDTSYFISMRSYPDEWSYALVQAACQQTGDSPEQLLRIVGHRWIRENTVGEYQELFALNGPDLYALLSNLNGLHASLGHQMPNLKPPSFVVFRDDEQTLRVHYYSTRVGLAPLVRGLLEGLCEFYQEPSQVTQTKQRMYELDYDEFCIHKQ